MAAIDSVIMNRLIPILLFLFSLISISAQPILRSPLSTNTATAAAAVGEIMQWNGAAWTPVNTSNTISAQLVNPNVVWFATNGNNATANGSLNKPFAGPSNAVAYARTTYGHNWTVRGRPGRYQVFGVPSTGFDQTNQAAICVHGATNSGIVLDPGVVLYSTNNATMLDLWQVDGFVVSGGRWEGTKHKTNSTAGVSLYSIIDLRNGSRNVVIENFQHINPGNHGIGLNSLFGSTNVIVRNGYQEDVGMTNGVPGLVFDGAGINVWGENWTIQNVIQRMFLRGIEVYGDCRRLTLQNVVWSECQLRGFDLVSDGGIGVSNIIIDSCVFANASPASSSMEIVPIYLGAGRIKRLDIKNCTFDVANCRYGIASIGSASAGVDVLDVTIANNIIRNQTGGDFIGVVFSAPGSGINSNITIINNKFSDLYSTAVSFSGQDSTIIGNTMEGVGLDGNNAINIVNSNGKEQRNKIIGNHIRGYAAMASGIRLYNFLSQATNNYVAGNHIYSFANQPIIDDHALGLNKITYNFTTTNMFSGTNINHTTFRGNVGIGTNAPVTALDVNGAIKIQGPGVSFSFAPFLTNRADGELHVGRIDTTSTYAALGSGSDGTGVSINGTGGYFFNQSATSAGFSSSTAKAKITSPAVGVLMLQTNVAIGTNNAAATLHVVQATAAGQSLRLDDTNYTPRVQAGSYPTAPSNGGIWLGNVTPSTANYAIAGDGSSLFVNTPSANLNLAVAGAAQWLVNGAQLAPIADNAEFLGDSTHRIARVNVGTLGFTNDGPTTINGLLGLKSNTIPTVVAGYGYFWPSNYALYWVTPFKTNLVTDGN